MREKFINSRRAASQRLLTGQAWDTKFVNVWNLAINPDGTKLAAEVRLNLYDYTIAVNGKAWDQIFGCVWEPIFNPNTGGVVAPVRVAGKWTLAEDGKILWKGRFFQVWNQTFSPDGSRIAAIVSPKYGRWTVALDGNPWNFTFKDMVSDLTFSPDGKKVAAVGKEGAKYTLVVDGFRWRNDFDMVWKPVFSPDSQHLVTKVEIKGKFTIAVMTDYGEKRAMPCGSRNSARTEENPAAIHRGGLVLSSRSFR